MVNFYISNALGQQLSNSEPCIYSEIVVRGQNLQFQVICQNMAMFEQLNDKLLVDSKKVWSLKRL